MAMLLRNKRYHADPSAVTHSTSRSIEIRIVARRPLGWCVDKPLLCHRRRHRYLTSSWRHAWPNSFCYIPRWHKNHADDATGATDRGGVVLACSKERMMKDVVARCAHIAPELTKAWWA